jgi:hypothetical protein
MFNLYNEYARCVKCISHNIGALWVQTTPYVCPEGSSPTGGPEVMRRQCRNCSYAWHERPLDHATPEELQRMAQARAKDGPEKGCD